MVDFAGVGRILRFMKRKGNQSKLGIIYDITGERHQVHANIIRAPDVQHNAHEI